VWRLESLRYLELHPTLPDGSPPELKESFDALLAPLLLNSALAAVRVQPPTSYNATIAVKSSTRALDQLQLSQPDQGDIYVLHAIIRTTIC
jgi:peptidyl-prolyl isomerase D